MSNLSTLLRRLLDTPMFIAMEVARAVSGDATISACALTATTPIKGSRIFRIIFEEANVSALAVLVHKDCITGFVQELEAQDWEHSFSVNSEGVVSFGSVFVEVAHR